MQMFLGFPRVLWPLISHFPLLFPFFYNLSLFSFYSRVCLSFKLPFSVLRSLVSSSCSCFFSCSSMVDYSSVRVDCPSIAFLFARLGCLLESVEGECLKWVSLFVGEDCPYKFVLFLLFPLVSHFANVVRLLKMSEVRFSDLETGLSSFDDRVISEATSPSTLYKAWKILCSLTGKDKKQIRDRFQFLDSIKIRIPSDKKRVCHSYAHEVCFYKANFTSGPCFHIHLLLENFFLICTLLRHS